MAALALASSPLSAAELALKFKQGRRLEPRIAATLASLVRSGFISAAGEGTRFALRRAA